MLKKVGHPDIHFQRKKSRKPETGDGSVFAPALLCCSGEKERGKKVHLKRKLAEVGPFADSSPSSILQKAIWRT